MNNVTTTNILEQRHNYYIYYNISFINGLNTTLNNRYEHIVLEEMNNQRMGSYRCAKPDEKSQHVHH